MSRLPLRFRRLLTRRARIQEQLERGKEQSSPTPPSNLSLHQSAGVSSPAARSLEPSSVRSSELQSAGSSSDGDEEPTPVEMIPHVPVGAKPPPETYEEVRARAQRKLEFLELRRRPRRLLELIVSFLRRLFRR